VKRWNKSSIPIYTPSAIPTKKFYTPGATFSSSICGVKKRVEGNHLTISSDKDRVD